MSLMRALLLILACFMFSELAFAHGGWVSGGGEGLACWSTQELADVALDHEGRLTAEGRKTMTSLSMADIREQGAEPPTLPQPGEKVDDYIWRLLTVKAKITGAFFSEVLNSLLIETGIGDETKWQDQPEGLAKLDDAGERWGGSKPNCRFVQIALRLENRQPGQITQVKMRYDRDLYERLYWMNEKREPGLGVFNQAVLKLHETFYLIRTEMGYHDSDAARLMLRTWLGTGEWVQCEDQRTCHNARILFKVNLLMAGYNEYPVVLDMVDPSPAPEFSYLSRRRAFASRAHKALKILHGFSRANELNWQINFVTTPKMREKFEEVFEPQLNDEEAFLEFAEQAYIDEASPYMVDLFLLRENSLALSLVCQLAEQNRKISNWENLQKAARYCRAAAQIH